MCRPRPIWKKAGSIIAGRFKLLQQIGEGGMGAVWMADQFAPIKRRVALKVIKPGMDSSQVLARFDAERQALALMDHPNIAKVLDAGTSECGRPFFVMELVKGIPTTKYCAEKHLSLQAPDKARTELIGSSKLLRGEVDWIVMKALDIRRFLADEPVRAGPPSAAYRLRKFVKRNAVAVIAASIVLLTLVFGVVGTSGGMVWALIAQTEADRQRNDAQAQEKRAVIAEADAQNPVQR